MCAICYVLCAVYYMLCAMHSAPWALCHAWCAVHYVLYTRCYVHFASVFLCVFAFLFFASTLSHLLSMTAYKLSVFFFYCYYYYQHHAVFSFNSPLTIMIDSHRKRIIKTCWWLYSQVVLPDLGGPMMAIRIGTTGLGLGCFRYVKGLATKVSRADLELR